MGLISCGWGMPGALMFVATGFGPYSVNALQLRFCCLNSTVEFLFAEAGRWLTWISRCCRLRVTAGVLRGGFAEGVVGVVCPLLARRLKIWRLIGEC